jgi:hypothetical protein
MATGGIVGIGIAITLASGLLFQDAETDLAIVFVASLLSVGGLVRIYGRQGVPALHAAANVALVVGMVLLTALLATQGLLVGLFGLAVSLAVVGLRIDMSRLRHLSIFLGCPWREACRGASAVASAA